MRGGIHSTNGMFALVVRGAIHPIDGIDAPYVGSCCESTSFRSMNGIDAAYVGSCCESRSIRSMNGTDAPYVGSCCESTSIHSMNGTDAPYVGSCCERRHSLHEWHWCPLCWLFL